MKGITLNQFRIFGEPINIEFAPITILTGRNNSGKSSIIKGLLLLADYLQQDQHLTLHFNEALSIKHKLDGFDNTCYWYKKKNIFELGIMISENIQYNFSFIPQPKTQDALISKFELFYKFQSRILLERQGQTNVFYCELDLNLFNTIRSDHKGSREKEQVIKEIDELRKDIDERSDQRQFFEKGSKDYLELVDAINRLKKGRENLEERLKSYETSSKVIKREINLNDFDEDYTTYLTIPDLVQRFLMVYLKDEEKKEGEKEFINTRTFRSDYIRYYQELRRLLNVSIDYLGPNRTYQSRIYLKENTFTEINQISNQYAKNTPRSGSKIKKFLQKWLAEFDVGTDIKIDDIQHSASSIFILNGDKKQINLADKGYGAGQITTTILKIVNIVQNNPYVLHSTPYYLWKSMQRSERISSTLIIEEPETNLHPAFQSKLTDMFYEAHREFNVNFIIETHSEYLIRKLQVLAAQDQIDREKVCIYYLDRNKENKEIKPKKLLLREDGSLTGNFGTGFFDEAAGHAMNLLKLKKGSSKNI